MKWVLLLLPLPAFAQPVIRSQPPHEHGWFLGDELTQRVVVDLPEGVTLDSASLPRPRAVDYWLDLRRLESQETTHGVELTLIWQNFYAAISADRRQVPASPIRFSDGTEAELPGFEFVTSPIRPFIEPSVPDAMLSDPRFQLIDTWPDRARLALSLAASLALLAAMAWHQAWWPFRTRPMRPFTQAARAIGKLGDPVPQRRTLHRALDASFGRVLIGRDLPNFLQARPEYAPLSDRLSDFFRASDSAFFGSGPEPVSDVPALARDMARIERGQK